MEDHVTYIKDVILKRCFHGDQLAYIVMAPGSSVPTTKLKEVFSIGITFRQEDNTVPIAEVGFHEGKYVVNISSGWYCERWCTAYVVLKSAQDPGKDGKLFDIPEFVAGVEWPEAVPHPSLTEDPITAQLHHFFPYIFGATVLHELGHFVYRDEIPSGPTLEFACDAFSVNYLLGTRGQDDKLRGIILISCALWLCAMCFEKLADKNFHLQKGKCTHPNSIERLEQYLNTFVLPEDEVSRFVWCLATSRIALLARQLLEARLGEAMEKKSQPEILAALKTLWEKPLP